MGKNEIDRLRPSQLIGDKTAIKKLLMPSQEERSEQLQQQQQQENVEPFANQVSGHTRDGKNFGMMKYKSMVLKPIGKTAQGVRESNFYEELNHARSDAFVLQAMRPFTAQYFGPQTITMPSNNTRVECIALEDLTRGFIEPCIMDVKIGQRTWDPNATYEKIQQEHEKYKETKRAYGLSMTGFQVYDVRTGKLTKYGKDYGKKLNQDSIIDAFKIFLNAGSSSSSQSLNRNLIVQLLVNLWRIQDWARKQNAYRLYSSSILLIYDARRLRQTLEADAGASSKSNNKKNNTKTNNKMLLYRPLSLAVLQNDDDGVAMRTGFSGQLNQDGPILSQHHRRVDSQCCTKATSPTTTPTICLKRMHSFQNNYDKDLQSIKEDYAHMLDDLVCDARCNELWTMVKLIDFAHVYPADNHQIDGNYLHGVESLVQIFEAFLAESN